MKQTHTSSSEPQPQEVAAPRRRWMILGMLMALCFISHFNRASITSAGDERIMRQYSISPESMGMIYSSFLVVYTVFMIPGGWILDRKGHRFALTAMGLGSAAFCAITGAVGFHFIPEARVWIALLLVRAAMGLFSTPLHPGAAKAVGAWFPASSHSLANGLITGASILAYAAVHPLFGALIDRVDWPTAFLIAATLTAILAAAWCHLAKTEPPAAPRAAGNSPQILQGNPGSAPALPWWRNSSLVWITLSYSAVGYFQYLFFYWLHYYFDSILHMAKDDSRFYAGLPSLAMAACMPVGGFISDRLLKLRGPAGLTIVPKYGMMASAAFLLMGIQSTQVLWIVTLFTLSLGLLGLCEASFWTVGSGLGGIRGGTTAAIMNTGGNGIGLLAPMLTPLIGEKLGWTYGIGIGAAIGLLGALCWTRIHPEISTPVKPAPVDQSA